ncbi:hypothetical protein BWQ96_07217 [Gracilariopsis chorda]|uniref:MoaB/Mog domain-containing protein n=1 Tax=Gracilariopsis chorda TaxID=448386 RepID=A0A2V3IPL6_9FLOR|nr:hypothetical protein BWQ96_07217 [Gracilariopsis chorda]|eukprot:PXF43070.1 hypothetical protein BWQ96_07217 [Gracilariopsis chorda]
MINRKSAAALIIGDEILSGKTLDTNTQTLAKHLVRMGVTLQKTETIRDSVDIISEAVKRLSESHDMVFTSGGIGPTLDDLTYEGVAKAFGLNLLKHEATIARMHEIQPNLVLNEARLRMATLPEKCDAIWTGGLWVPLVCVHNVYVLPGIPRLFSSMIESIPSDHFGDVPPRERKILWCDLAEGDLAATLDKAAKEYDVAIGSYPATNNDSKKLYRTMVTVEGDEADIVIAAAEQLKGALNARYGTV